MDKEKIEDNNTNPEPIDTTEKALDGLEKTYYEDLYNDLPKEVVDILMQTHPLMGNQDEDATAYRTKHTEKGTLDAVKEARMKQVNEEIRKMQEEQEPSPEEKPHTSKRNKKKRKQEGSEQVSPEKVGDQIEESPVKGNNHNEKVNTIGSEDEAKPIQFVKIKSDDKKSKAMESENLFTKYKKKLNKPEKHEQEGKDSFGEKLFEKKKYIYEEFDVQKKEKEENLNLLYEEGEEEEVFVYDKRKVFTIALAVAGVLFLFLAVKCISLSFHLAKAKEEISTHTDISAKYEELQMENLSLQDQIKVLSGGVPTKKGDGTKTGKDGALKPAKNGEYDIYTTKLDDTFWDISQQFYGNGAYFTRILEANGLGEFDTVHEGQQLKIPKQ